MQGLRFLGRVPVDSEFVKVVDGPGAEVLDGSGNGGNGQTLIERYKKTPSAPLLEAICREIVGLVEGGVAGARKVDVDVGVDVQAEGVDGITEGVKGASTSGGDLA